MPDHSIISSDLEIKSGGSRQLQCSSAFARRRLVLTELVSATVQPNTGDSKQGRGNKTLQSDPLRHFKRQGDLESAESTLRTRLEM